MGRGVLPTCVSLMLLAAVLALPEAARAASIEAKGRAAKIACLSGDYAKGVALLAEMFVSTGNAIHLFNQGRCFEQNGKYEEAIVRFREFLRKHPEKDVPGLAAAKHIVDCEALIDEQKAKASPPPPVETKPVAEPVPAPAPAPVVPIAVPPPAPVVSPLVEAPAAAPAEPVTEGKPFYKTWWFWTAAGTVLVAGTATAFLLTRSAPDACDGAGTRCVGVK